MDGCLGEVVQEFVKVVLYFYFLFVNDHCSSSYHSSLPPHSFTTLIIFSNISFTALNPPFFTLYHPLFLKPKKKPSISQQCNSPPSPTSSSSSPPPPPPSPSSTPTSPTPTPTASKISSPEPTPRPSPLPPPPSHHPAQSPPHPGKSAPSSPPRSEA